LKSIQKTILKDMLILKIAANKVKIKLSPKEIRNFINI